MEGIECVGHWIADIFQKQSEAKWLAADWADIVSD